MKASFEFLRISFLLAVAGLFLLTGESVASAAEAIPMTISTVTVAALPPAASAPVGQGAAFGLGAYGFMLLLRRRGLRLN